MTNQVLLDLIRNSAVSLVLVKTDGEIVLYSRKFEGLITDIMPYESNFLEMLMHTKEIQSELLNMFQNKKIDCNLFPYTLTFENNIAISISCFSKLSIKKEELILLKLDSINKTKSTFIDSYINSKHLFINKSKASIVYNSSEEKIIAKNKIANEFIFTCICENETFPDNFIDEIKNLVKIAKIGDISSKTSKLIINEQNLTISFECSVIENYYFLITFKDITSDSRKDEIHRLNKERAHNLIDVIPGVLFEFEIINDKLVFTFISEGIKELIGLSAEHILKDSNLLFAHFNKIERARLHYFFTSLSEKERKIRNEFKINDSNNNPKWVTIDWRESYTKEGVLRGTGYLDDISEKKRIQKEKKEIESRKNLKEYFSISLLRQSDTSELLDELSKTIVRKLKLQDTIIYLYNSSTRMLEYGASSTDMGATRINYPRIVSSEKGIIGRVIKSQKSEIINNSSDDEDYYFIDKPSESEITVPIIFEGELLGIIDSENIRPNFFSTEHLNILEDIAESLAIRLVQIKRQDDNLKFHKTLSSIFNQGKIFTYKYDFESERLNNTCIDNFIDLLEIIDKNEKISIYDNQNLLLKYVLQFDISLIDKYIKDIKRLDNYQKDLTFRVSTRSGHIKWIKLSVSKVNKIDTKLVSAEGTFQDISEFKELENKNKGFESLLSSINVSQLQLEKDNNFNKSMGIIGDALGICRIVISKFTYAEGKIFVVDTEKWIKNDNIFQGDDSSFLNLFDDFNYKELIENNSYWDISEIEFTDQQKLYLKDHKTGALIGFPLKTSKGLWGAIYFIEEDEKRIWKDYEKNLLNGFANFIALKIQNFKLLEDFVSHTSNVK